MKRGSQRTVGVCSTAQNFLLDFAAAQFRNPIAATRQTVPRREIQKADRHPRLGQHWAREFFVSHIVLTDSMAFA
jgi:hypothetical protein